MDTSRTDSQRIAVIEDTVLDLKKRLLGNGQPGEIDKMDARISALERLAWMGGGMIALAGIGWAFTEKVLSMVSR